MVINNKYSSCYAPYKTGSYDMTGVCFARGYRSESVKNKYINIMYIIPHNFPQKLAFCYLSIEDTISYIREVCKLLGCKFICSSSNKSDIRVQIQIPENRRFFLFVSTIIRYCYEDPWAPMCYCAMKNRDLFPKLNIIQLTQLYIGAFINHSYNHALLGSGNVLTNINMKSCFNIMRDYFNSYIKSIHSIIEDDYVYLCDKMCPFNTKTIPYISRLISLKLKTIYDKYEKSICRWGR